MSRQPLIIWLRNCHRLTDNPMLTEAVATGRPLIPVVVLDATEDGDWLEGEASKWWRHYSLQSLAHDLEAVGSQLILKQGRAIEILSELCDNTGADTVFYNHRYEPAALILADDVTNKLSQQGIAARGFHTNVLTIPGTMNTQGGTPYKVFTPYWKRIRPELDTMNTLPKPASLPAPKQWPDSKPLESCNLLPSRNWADVFSSLWTPGEAGALKQLQHFSERSINRYDAMRDIPGEKGTSRLSPHLHFGEISPRQIAQTLLSDTTLSRPDRERYLSQLGWRDFGHHLLYHFPETLSKPLSEKFNAFPWVEDTTALQQWQRGMTGYPIVDAGMRELWQTGWMHNRVRMIVASFLVKHLRIHWQEGARWFWDTLLDADLANNTMGWQWVAGCGADAAPYFRIFNPMLQGRKFDPDGSYVRRWVPELARLSTQYIHEPWKAPALELLNAGVTLGETYPNPIVVHEEARAQALDAYKRLAAAG